MDSDHGRLLAAAAAIAGGALTKLGCTVSLTMPQLLSGRCACPACSMVSWVAVSRTGQYVSGTRRALSATARRRAARARCCAGCKSTRERCVPQELAFLRREGRWQQCCVLEFAVGPPSGQLLRGKYCLFQEG